MAQEDKPRLIQASLDSTRVNHSCQGPSAQNSTSSNSAVKLISGMDKFEFNTGSANSTARANNKTLQCFCTIIVGPAVMRSLGDSLRRCCP